MSNGLQFSQNALRVLLGGVALCASAWTQVAAAQALPPPAQTVYKCEENGKFRYSDEPCMGGRRVDVTPTRGLNASTGRELIGKDVRREISREAMADALRPLMGMDARTFDRTGRRTRLSAEVQRSCRYLDGEIVRLERVEAQLTGTDLKQVQRELFERRTQYHHQGCD